MSNTFELQKNRKAFTYTAIICAIILLIAILWKWPITELPTPIAEDLIEVNLGNFDEGMGEIQPLIKGDKSPNDEAGQQTQAKEAANDEPTKDVQPDDNDDAEAATVIKPEKPTPTEKITPTQPTTQPVKNTTPTPAVSPVLKPQKPKIPGYGGDKGGKGNGANEDNGYTMQGNKPGGKGDAGSGDGKPDGYGNNRGGGGGGGPRVTSGDRKIIKYYSFTGELDKATIYATIKVSPDGRGQFTGFGKNSTTRNPAYSNAITEYLRNIKFDASDHESVVTVQFNFTVN
jgi:hypothetical protein